jgi:hypothetical protein
LPSKIHRLRVLKRFSTSAWTHILYISLHGRRNSHKFFTMIWAVEHVHSMSVNSPGWGEWENMGEYASTCSVH